MVVPIISKYRIVSFSKVWTSLLGSWSLGMVVPGLCKYRYVRSLRC